jgi:hypothetical protein
LKIDLLLKTIKEWENNLSTNKKAKTAQHLISLYNKAIEYYAALNKMEESQEYLARLKLVFSDPDLQSSIDTGTI